MAPLCSFSRRYLARSVSFNWRWTRTRDLGKSDFFRSLHSRPARCDIDEVVAVEGLFVQKPMTRVSTLGPSSVVTKWLRLRASTSQRPSFVRLRAFHNDMPSTPSEDALARLTAIASNQIWLPREGRLAVEDRQPALRPPGPCNNHVPSGPPTGTRCGCFFL